jgi:acetylornithine/N-succinyldiaminopimelate aminotransferase
MNKDIGQAQKLENTHHLQLYKRYPLTLVRGEGSRVWDSTGKEYIDALAGIAVNSLGHCHPAVVKAVQQQASKLIHVSNFYFNEPQSRLAQLLCQASGLDRAFFCNSGAEAVEAAIKLVRKHAASEKHKGDIVAMEKCFHGRTIATITMGSKKYREGFGPLPAGFKTIPMNDFQALDKALKNDPIAFILEVVQGEGGINLVDHEYLVKLRDICTEMGILLVLDEVQCGMARTGKMFAYQHHGIKPDIVTVAKALGNGMPIGAMLTTDVVAEAFAPGDHGTTFGGNPLACAAACAVLETMADEEITEAAARKGEYLVGKLRQATSDWDAVNEVRGLGLMVGVELAFKGADVVLSMMDKGVLTNCTAETVIRLTPPLTITEEELDRIVECLISAITEVERQMNV